MFAPRHTSRSRARGLQLWLALLVCTLFSACETYPERISSAFRDFEGGRFEQAMGQFGDVELTGSPFLSGAEAGTVALTAGDWEEALRQFARAVAETEDLDDRALLGASNLAEGLGSFVLNDTTQAYRGEGFERVYAHVGLAIAYLAQGKMQDVYVEARLANQLLESEQELYDADYGAGGLGHFLSAIAYELRGELDEAYIDYERMANKGVGLELAGPALVRIAAELRRQDAYERWRQRFGEAADVEGMASIVLVGGVGLGPFKDEIKIAVPTGNGSFNMAVPTYVQRPQAVSALRLELPNSGASVRSVEVEDVGRIAEENLSDRIAYVTGKSVARGVAKRELTQRLDEELGIAGAVAGELFSFFSERADLRCWTTLPNSWHGARLFVPPGQHEVVLAALGGERAGLGTYELEAGETMFVIARSVHSRLYTEVLGGLQVD